MANTWIPTVEVESAHGVREVSLNTRHLMNSRIFLTGEIDSQMANDFVSQLIYLEQEHKGPVTIYINSTGGAVSAGLMIYDAIQCSSLDINMICTGLAASMAAVIFASGRAGHRYILKHGKVMIHEPLIANMGGGSATSIKNISDSILETKRVLNEILAKHCNKTVEEIDEATGYDNYMNADEAIEYGICDAVIDKLIVE